MGVAQLQKKGRTNKENRISLKCVTLLKRHEGAASTVLPETIDTYIVHEYYVAGRSTNPQSVPYRRSDCGTPTFLHPMQRTLSFVRIGIIFEA